MQINEKYLFSNYNLKIYTCKKRPKIPDIFLKINNKTFKIPDNYNKVDTLYKLTKFQYQTDFPFQYIK